MKYVICIILCLAILESCKKSNGGDRPRNNLNTMELKLVGTWQLIKEADTIVMNGAADTVGTVVYSSFPSGLYVSFSSGDYGVGQTGAPYLKYMDDAMGIGDTSVSGAERAAGQVLLKASSWYYDIQQKRLILSKSRPMVDTVNHDILVLKARLADSGSVQRYQTLYFEK